MCNQPSQQTFNAIVFDISGKTTSKRFRVTLTCTAVADCPSTLTASVGKNGNLLPLSTADCTLPQPKPQLSDPIPNPLTISANVGQTASGSSSFSNSGDPGSILHFTLSGDAGLSVSPSTGTLEGGKSQSVNVDYACTTAGTFNETVTVSSSDEGVESKTVNVVVECTLQPLDFEPKNLSLEGDVGEDAVGTVRIINPAAQSQRVDLTSGDPIYVRAYYNGNSVNSVEVEPGESILITLKVYCNDAGTRDSRFNQLLSYSIYTPKRNVVPIRYSCKGYRMIGAVQEAVELRQSTATSCSAINGTYYVYEMKDYVFPRISVVKELQPLEIKGGNREIYTNTGCVHNTEYDRIHSLNKDKTFKEILPTLKGEILSLLPNEFGNKAGTTFTPVGDIKYGCPSIELNDDISKCWFGPVTFHLYANIYALVK